MLWDANLILLCQILWKAWRFIKECKLSLIFKDGPRGLHVSQKMHPGWDAFALTSRRHPSGHSSPHSWAAEYVQTLTIPTLILILLTTLGAFFEPGLTHHSPSRWYHPAPRGSALWSGFLPVSAGHYQMGVALWSVFLFCFAKTKVMCTQSFAPSLWAVQ